MKNMLNFKNFSAEELMEILEIAQDMKKDPDKYAHSLEGKKLYSLFEKTSKISIQDIIDAEKQSAKIKEEKAKRIASPYTIVKPKKRDNRLIFYALLSIVIIISLILIIFNIIRPKKNKIVKELKESIGGEVYEFTK